MRIIPAGGMNAATGNERRPTVAKTDKLAVFDRLIAKM